MDTKHSDINAYILTGGQSCRFGEPKCLVKIGNKTLTDIIYANLQSIFKNIGVIGKENYLAKYNFIEDLHPVQCPMNGIVSALEHTTTDWIFVIACDLPLIIDNIINYLYYKGDFDRQAVVPIAGDKLQPLCGFYNKSILDDLNESIKMKNYSLFKILNQLDISKIVIPLNYSKQFLNVNYPDDLKKVDVILKSM